MFCFQTVNFISVAAILDRNKWIEIKVPLEDVVPVLSGGQVETR